MSFEYKTLVRPAQPSEVEAVYADSYAGRWINFQIGTETDRKLIKPKIDFFRKGGRAIVFGNGPSRSRLALDKFNLSNKHKHLKIYNILYGCNMAFTEQGDFDFLVINNLLLSTLVPKSLYPNCYATPEIVQARKEMDLIPCSTRMDSGSTAALLACYHGADKVFLYGFDGLPGNKNDNIYAGQKFCESKDSEISDITWQHNLRAVMLAYPDVTFYRVNTNPPNARILTVLPNYKLITFNDFVSIADI